MLRRLSYLMIHLPAAQACARPVALGANIGASLAILCLMFPFAAPAQEPAGPVVAITGGQIQGRSLPAPDAAVFKGIPFAAAPVGDLRWREPQPVKPWIGVRQAAEYGAICPQNNGALSREGALKTSEDCLFLNIWAPEWPPKTKKPVMFWIHGGGNTGGSAIGAGNEPEFDGASLARHGVVMVTINYRLGLLGFIGHPELTAESPHHASGGYGLLDQIAALKWVHENIAHFGGDPANVTVFGQSAGGQNTSILLTSPPAKGLFHKAIAQSGSPMISDKRLQTPAQMEQLGVILAEALKAPATGAVKYMRSLPAAEILAAMPEFRTHLNGLILDIGMDGYAVPQFSPEVYRSGKEMAIPMIVGTTGRESGGPPGPGTPARGTAPSTGAAPGPGGRGANRSPEELRNALKGRIEAAYRKYPDLLERALKIYGFSGSENEISTYPPYGTADAQFGTDDGMRCEADAIAGWHSAIAPTWQYEFTAGSESRPPVHTAELRLVFGTFLGGQEPYEGAGKVSAVMQQYWTNFAKTGDPNGPGLPVWLKHDAKSRQYLELSNDGPLAKAALRAAACGVYMEKLTRDLNARK